jgi:hypothetical protein
MTPVIHDDFALPTVLPDGPVDVLAVEVTEQILVRQRRVSGRHGHRRKSSRR